jgi:hypothetical protein
VRPACHNCHPAAGEGIQELLDLIGKKLSGSMLQVSLLQRLAGGLGKQLCAPVLCLAQVDVLLPFTSEGGALLAEVHSTGSISTLPE